MTNLTQLIVPFAAAVLVLVLTHLVAYLNPLLSESEPTDPDDDA